MAQINEILIRQVFDEMVKYNPRLQNAASMDDIDDEIDYRVLGDLIIRSLPWPIGIELRRLFSANMRQLDRGRLDQIFKTIERTMQFLSFVMICQVWDECVKSNLQLPKNITNDFESRFSVLSMGNFTWVIRALGDLMKKQNLKWYVEEIPKNFDKKFFDSLDFWVPERNEIGHYQINLTQEDIETRCMEYEKKLTSILQKISFLVLYRFVSIREIKIEKFRFRNPRFKFKINLLNNTHSDFQSQDKTDENFTECGAVLLMKNIKNLSEYLNLSPLIIDTYSETIDSGQKFSVKKDIFLYTKYRDEHLMYIGTEATEKCDLRPLTNYPILVEEFKELLKTFKPKE